MSADYRQHKTQYRLAYSLQYASLKPISLRGNLEGQSHEIFDPRIVHQSIPLVSLINGLKHFCIWL
jgi:hypothetical protein